MTVEQKRQWKKNKWKKYPNRAFNALQTSCILDNISELKENLIIYNEIVGDIKVNTMIELFYLALTNNSINCSSFIIENYNILVNTKYIMANCKYEKMHLVWDLTHNLMDIYPNKIINNIENKKFLIERLIAPEKIQENNARVEYLISQISLGFFSASDIKDCISTTYKDKNKAPLISLMREIKLNEIGI